jgi:adenylosuccinate synthase
VATHHSTILNGLDDLAVTCLDGLDTLDTIKVCLAYRAGQMKVDYVPTDIEMLAKCEPVYAEFPGWKTSTTRCAKWRDLPVKARNYLRALSELTGARLKIVSVGPEREQTIFI